MGLQNNKKSTPIVLDEDNTKKFGNIALEKYGAKWYWKDTYVEKPFDIIISTSTKTIIKKTFLFVIISNGVFKQEAISIDCSSIKTLADINNINWWVNSIENNKTNTAFSLKQHKSDALTKQQVFDDINGYLKDKKWNNSTLSPAATNIQFKINSISDVTGGQIDWIAKLSDLDGSNKYTVTITLSWYNTPPFLPEIASALNGDPTFPQPTPNTSNHWTKSNNI